MAGALIKCNGAQTALTETAKLLEKRVRLPQTYEKKFFLSYSV